MTAKEIKSIGEIFIQVKELRDKEITLEEALKIIEAKK